VLSAALALDGWLHPVPVLATSAIKYVQGNYATPQTSQTTVTVSFTKAEAAGDLNVVVVGWFDTTAVVSTVTDASGNTYARAVGPTTINSSPWPISQSIYYAKNIAAAAPGANTVTVTFSTAAAYPDIRILEYSAADPNNPVDVTAGSSSATTSTTTSSGSATTTSPTDLVFGANTVDTSTTGPGSGFTQRLLTSPDGDIAEDEMVTAAGSYSATAPLSPSGPWVMQMVAFRTPAVALGSFTLSASPASLSVAQGSQGTSTITTTVSGSFSSTISLSASGAPSGTTVGFNPSAITGTGTSTMTITAGSSTALGTYPLTVTAKGGGIQHNTTITLKVVATISYVQGNYATPHPSGTTVNVTFNTAQAAGDLNVVVVGWNDTTAVVSTVTDSRGNTYALGIGPTIYSSSAEPNVQSIYYAKNIAAAAAGANTVTVTFSTAAAHPDIRILEYSGADPNNPVDVTAASSGNSTTSSSGSMTTTNPTDLLFAANTVWHYATGPGSGFTQRLLTSPNGDIAEDRMVKTKGTYSATAPLGGSAGSWVMQMVAFRAASGVPVSSSPLSASPTSVRFGNVVVGSRKSQSINLSNTGTISVTVSQATAKGSGFSISGLSLPLTLPSGQSATFSAIFSPTTAGSISGSISIASNASGSATAVPLSGTGITLVLSASPASTSFGNVVLGSSSTLPVILTNTGTASVTISQDSVTGRGFSISGPALPFTLPAGQNTDFSLTFAPATAGSVTGSASILSNATNSPNNEPLSGNGIHAVSLSWTASTTPVAGYNVYRARQSRFPVVVICDEV
jgi:hypothetical protein